MNTAQAEWKLSFEFQLLERICFAIGLVSGAASGLLISQTNSPVWLAVFAGALICYGVAAICSTVFAAIWTT